MPLIQQTHPNEEPRYDTETLRKVTALAQRIQARQEETVTASEMEDIGQELGLDRSVVRQALNQITAAREPATIQQAPPRISPQLAANLVGAWWAAGWCIPFVLVALAEAIFGGRVSGGFFFLGWGVYIGGGIVMSSLLGEEDEKKPKKKRKKQVKREVSRADLLDALFTLQGALEIQKQHRAFLSVDVAGSAEMKRGQDELAVEHSFGQLQSWIGDTVRAYGGELHSAAGDGMMCAFRDDVAALRAARALQEGIEHFNRGRNRLSQPFRLRCGVTAGEVAVDPQLGIGQMHSPIIDRAAQLRQSAEPGDIIVSGELAAAGIAELGGLVPGPASVSGGPSFSWCGAQPHVM
ncbi:MAG: hypothetical protein ACO1SX_10925 [Actinomycetota bacterium]